MIDEMQFRQSVIKPALEKIGLYSKDAEELLVATMAHESQGGNYLLQNGGPALGIYQMEPFTHDDLWNSFLSSRNKLAYDIITGCKYATRPTSSELIYNLQYATMMTRVFYERMKAPLPVYEDIGAIAQYWKQYYNTPKGKGTVEEFIDSYKRYTGAPKVERSKPTKKAGGV